MQLQEFIKPKGQINMKAPFGWTVIVNGLGKIVTYKRDCLPPADLAPFTFPTMKLAEENGKAGHYAYRRV